MAGATAEAEPRIAMDEESAEQLKIEVVGTGAMALAVREATAEIDMARRRADALRAATIAHTLPTDWCRMGEKAYLQNCGCERVAALWGIEVEPIKPGNIERTEYEEEESEGLRVRHVKFEVLLTGHSKRTGERKTEIGSRSTYSGFFHDRYVEGSTAERELIIDDVKKSALTNAHGRLTRALTGMSGIPIAELQKLRMAIGQIPRVDYQTGGKGGATNPDDATEPQLKLIARLAAEQGRVEGLGKGDQARTFEALSSQCRVSKKIASVLIETLKSAEDPMPAAEFWKRVNRRAAAPQQPPAAGQAAPPEGKA